MTVPADLDRIERALKDMRQMTVTFANRAPPQLWDDLTWALEALERMREAWRERPAQVTMWDG